MSRANALKKEGADPSKENKTEKTGEGDADEVKKEKSHSHYEPIMFHSLLYMNLCNL